MKRPLVVVLFLAVAGCVSPGTAEDFKWSIECPKSVDKGAEFVFAVRASNASDEPVAGVKYRFQILWTAGSASPLRHKGRSGEAIKVHARMAAGPATLVVTCENRDGLEVTVLETTFEVK